MDNHRVSKIRQLAKEFFPRIVEIRRELHQHPELSFNEAMTARRIMDILSKEKIGFTDGWAGHGIVAEIKGQQTGPTVMLRADIDALPIQEENEIEYKSVNDGVMHACGHDVHTSSLLGAAMILNHFKSEMNGTVRMIFQPGEEKLPGGASMMIKEGLFHPDPPQCIIGQHVFPALPAGHVGFREGQYMASADEIYVTINGKGGHAATPHVCIDPILIAARVITGLQVIISRHVDPMTPAVLSIGKVYSVGGATNVIPDKVYLEGTLRAMDEKWRYEAHHMITNLIDHICQSSGAHADIRLQIGYPSLYNNEKVTAQCREMAIQYLGADKVHELPQRMSSEDFAFYTQLVPGTFYRLGTGRNDGGENYPVHSNRFNIDETSLETGMGLMAFMALSQLEQEIN